MMNAEQFNEMYELFEAVREEVITDEQFSRLNQLLAENKQICKYYIEYINMSATLKSGKAFDKHHAVLSSSDSSLCDLRLWQEMADYEKATPGIKITQEKAKDELIQKVQHQKVNHKISNISLFSLVATAAAIILIVVFARFAPPATGIKVAVLLDSTNAKWAVEGILEKGSPIFTSRENLLLREGYVKVLYDSQAQVMIEGPAEFQILAEDKINLIYGKIYAMVPPKAIGFMITTQSAKVIDLGTEFGVSASFDGTTELHVYQGKTTLIAGVSQDSKRVVEVVAGNAKRTRTDSSQVMDISLNETLFVREIDSSKNLIWHGQPLDLVSVVAGGGGFSPGQTTRGIDPATGQIHAKAVQGFDRLANNTYRSVEDESGIDGVFVPNGTRGATVVSSAGHTFAFPETNDMYYSDITSYPYVQKLFPPRTIALSLSPLAAGEKPNSPLLFIHSSAGITFNLDEIRQSVRNLEIDRFISSCGISQDEGPINRSEFWVLIDGQCVFHDTLGQDHPEAGKIDVSITPQQKFLTLVTTNGGDTISLDWCVFDKPQLVLAQKQLEVSQADHDAGVEK